VGVQRLELGQAAQVAVGGLDVALGAVEVGERVQRAGDQLA